MNWPHALFVISFFVMAPAVRGHGFMFEPAARNTLSGIDTPTGLSAGGPWEASGHNTRTWPNSANGLCGDQASDSTHMHAGRPVRAYASGGIISISLLLESNHGGRHMFRLCDRPNIDEACFAGHVLQRADGTGPYTWVAVEPAGGPAYPASGYEPSIERLGFTGEAYTFDYRLPDGVTCANCVLQWWWTTSNSCDIPGNPLGANDLGPCNTPPPGPYPEEFWNCADISIGATPRKLLAA